ncbi:MAG TPA: oligosaccharide flippase family protein [Solirubrobacteraceae bacterium]|jgi:O-antigen/teichoic acid export membrane protein|nr:oligosaccharide flippase family protein [Solirubrobacteraceae bacterium]
MKRDSNIRRLHGPVTQVRKLTEGQIGLLLHPIALVRHLRGDSLHRNSVYMMAITVLTSLLGFVYWILVAHAYGTREVGLAAALISAMTLASMLTNLGINTALVQILPQRESGLEWSATLNAGLLVGVGSSLAGGLVTLVLLPAISHRFSLVLDSAGLAIWFVVGVAATTLTNIIDYACIAERAAGRMLVRNVVFSLAKIPLVLLPVIVAMGTLGIMFSWAVSAGVVALVMFLLLPQLRRGYTMTRRSLGPEIRRLSSYLAGHHAMNIGSFLPFWLLPVLVTARVSTVATAYFYATWRVAGMLYMIAPAVGQSLSAEGAADPEHVWRKALSSARFTGILLVPASLALLVLGPFILLFFGHSYESAGLPLLVLFVLGAFPDAVMNLYTGILRVEGRLRLGGWLQLGTAFIALACSWLLLPTMGITAAGIGWLASRLIGCAVIYVDRRLATDRLPRFANESGTRTGS